MKQTTVFLLTILSVVLAMPLSAEMNKGSRVKCNKKGSGKYFSGKVMWNNGRLLGVQYDAGGRESTHVSNCRSIDSSQPTTTNTTKTSKSTKFKKGDRVRCNWKNKGKYYPGKIRKINRRGRLYITYDDGDKERTRASRCRLSNKRKPKPTTTTTNNNDSNKNNRRKPVKTDTQKTNPAGAKTMFQYFAEASKRLRKHPSNSSLKMDRSVVGSYTKFEAGARRTYSILLHHFQFKSNGKGSFLRETFRLTNRDKLVVDSRKNVRGIFSWGVELHKTTNGEPVTLIRMKFGVGKSIRFYYALEPGKSMATLFYNENTQQAGTQSLFAEQRTFIRNWKRSNHEILRRALAKANKVDKEIQLRSLMNRNLQMGNNNMLMLNTMNMGFR